MKKFMFCMLAILACVAAPAMTLQPYECGYGAAFCGPIPNDAGAVVYIYTPNARNTVWIELNGVSYDKALGGTGFLLSYQNEVLPETGGTGTVTLTASFQVVGIRRAGRAIAYDYEFLGGSLN